MTGAVTQLRTWGAMIKFSHSIFALPFALLATFLAARPDLPSAAQLGLIVICMVAARSAAMTFNRLIDAQLDAANPRTADRPLPVGTISVRAAWTFFGASCLLFLAGCAGFLLLEPHNPWPLLLGVPTLAFLCFYSYAKRFTRYSHVMLGLAIAFSPVAAWIAISPSTLGPTAWLLLVGVTFWIGGFDIIYACQDVDFDRQVGLHSLPARLGIGPALWIARGFHVVTVAALAAVGWTAGLGWIYFAAVAIVTVMLAVENSLVSPTDLSKANIAFFTVNGAVSLLLGVFGIVDVLVP